MIQKIFVIKIRVNNFCSDYLTLEYLFSLAPSPTSEVNSNDKDDNQEASDTPNGQSIPPPKFPINQRKSKIHHCCRYR